ncbi:hypothetical protein GWI34_31130 [Actinomadura sp. DSM 109109]|nr:hypothetical protein [Actinomadura lepetitiana]
MNSEKPYSNRRFVIIAIAAFAAVLAAVLAFAAMSGGDDDRPGTTTNPPAASPSAEPRPLVLMVEHGEQHALLDLLFHPEGGQVSGKYTLVHFDEQGNPLRYPNGQGVNGFGTPEGFTLNGLGDIGSVKGSVLDGGSRVHFDQTFGIEEYDWNVVDSTSKFEESVAKFASCVKEHGTAYCESAR